jgi:hypothetical protein
MRPWVTSFGRAFLFALILDIIAIEFLGSLGKISPQLHKVKVDGLQNMKPQQLSNEYKMRKNRFLIAAHILDSYDTWTGEEKQRLVGAIWSHDALRTVLPEWLVDKKGKSKSLVGTIRNAWSEIVSTNDPLQEVVRQATAAVASDQVSDDIFVTQLPDMCDKEPLLLEAALRIGKIVRDNLQRMVEKVVHKVYAELHRAELGLIRDHLRVEAKIAADNEKRSSRFVLIQEINNSSGSDPT